MKMKSVVAGAAIALAVGLGSASAADPFTTLEGIPAAVMTDAQMGAVVAGHTRYIKVNSRGTSDRTIATYWDHTGDYTIQASGGSGENPTLGSTHPQAPGEGPYNGTKGRGSNGLLCCAP
jgi:hypothetical protein